MENAIDKSLNQLSKIKEIPFASLSPPDVVAQTKKENSSSSASSSNEEKSQTSSTVHSSCEEFQNSRVALPRKNVCKSVNESFYPIHHHENLILGKCSVESKRNTRKVEEASDANRVPGRKKKVTFSDTGESREKELSDENAVVANHCKCTREDSPKKMVDHSRSTSEQVSTTSFNENENRNETQLLEKLPNISSDSDSDSSDDRGNKEMNENREISGRELENKILKEFFEEAVIFMRNVNSIRRYVNATEAFKKGQKGIRKQGNRGKYCSTAKERRDYCKDPERNDVPMLPMESYKRCVEGMEKLENRIKKIHQHNDVLREKYGIEVESAGAKLDLANSSIDSSIDSNTDGHNVLQEDTRFVEFPNSSIESHLFAINKYDQSDLLIRYCRNLRNEEEESIEDSCKEFGERTLGGEMSGKSGFDFSSSWQGKNKFMCPRTNVTRVNFSPLTYPKINCSIKNCIIHENVREVGDLFVENENKNENLSFKSRSYENFGKSLQNDSSKEASKHEVSNWHNSQFLIKKPCSLYTSKHRLESPRMKFLELLEERRRIVESSRESNIFREPT